MRRLWPDGGEIDDVAEFVAGDARPPQVDRPWLLVNMVASLDGAITVKERSGPLAGPADRAMFFALRAVADVILVGAGTARAEGYGPARADADVRARRLARGQAELPRIAVVTRSLELPLDAPLFTESAPPPLVITCEAADPKRRLSVAERAEVLVAGREAVDLSGVLRELHTQGVGVVTCEGGPHLNGELLAGDLVDEWDLTLSPLLVGGTAGRASRGPTPPTHLPMNLDRMLEGDGMLLTRWLRAR